MSETSEAGDLATHVIRVIAQTQRIPAETISLDSTYDELKIDSLDGSNIVFALENEFAIEIPEEGVHSMRSIRQTVAGVAKLIASKQQLAVPPGAV
jgi:acyl carrier protein